MMHSPALVRPMVVALDWPPVEVDLCTSGCIDLFGRVLAGSEAIDGWGAEIGNGPCCAGSAGGILCLSSKNPCGCCKGGNGTCGVNVLVESRELSALGGLGIVMGVSQRGQLLRVGDSGNPHCVHLILV